MTAATGFLADILRNLREQPDRAAIIEVHGSELRRTDGHGVLDAVARARAYLRSVGVRPGDRVGLLAPNSMRWVAADLAILAEGAIVVPLYARQDPKELAVMVRNCGPVRVLASDAELAAGLAAAWPEHAPIAEFDEVFAAAPIDRDAPPVAREPHDILTIIYTSGTSGEPKGVRLSQANFDFMLPCTREQLGLAVSAKPRPDDVFHFLPLCFAASLIMLWTQLSRPNPVMLSTDLANLVQEIATAKPDYFLNVPAVLERIRQGVGAKLRERGGVALLLANRGEAAYRRIEAGQAGFLDRFWLELASYLVFTKVKEQIGPKLEFLVCGSAPLSPETQSWFHMLGIPVYQAYGLTETTGIVSFDRPGHVAAGMVGMVLPAVETRLSDEGELLVRGPNLFDGYWDKPDATAEAIRDGWFHTGDQVEVHDGRLKIIGRIKNLIIPESGHNISPEPIEHKFMEACPGAEMCMLVGHGKADVGILVTGRPDPKVVEQAMATVNAGLPHYKRIRRYHVTAEAFTVENGLLTANQKLRRGVIERHFAAQIEAMYR
jgi:long-chain acyl-CoA synthetase